MTQLAAMKRWHEDLQRNLDARRDEGLLRRLIVTDAEPESSRWVERGGRRLLNLASNDYLALADHPRVKQAAKDAIDRFGTGAGASRLVSGHTSLHERVERRFAAFKHAQAALLCPTGYQANLAAVTALAGPGDLICIDKLSHASLIDAAKASGAMMRVFPHRNLGKLERLLSRWREDRGLRIADCGLQGEIQVTSERDVHSKQSAIRNPQSAIPPRSAMPFILTDSIFSMDGDAADLPALCDLAEEHDAILIVDEAHGTGVLGETGAGLCEAQGVSGRVDVVISTASKALGGLGGVITSHQVVIDTIINHGRSFIYTTATPPAQAAAIEAALDVVRDEPWRRERVIALARRVKAQLAEMRMMPAHNDEEAIITPIIPIITGSAESALALAAHLESQGILAPAIRPPTVAPGAARVRLSLRADLMEDDVNLLIQALGSWRR